MSGVNSVKANGISLLHSKQQQMTHVPIVPDVNGEEQARRCVAGTRNKFTSKIKTNGVVETADDGEIVCVGECRARVASEDDCYMRKRCLGSPIPTSSPMTSQSKMARPPADMASSTEKLELRMKSRIKLFACETEVEGERQLDVTKMNNPFALVDESVLLKSRDQCDKRQSVLNLAQPLAGLDDSLDDSAMLKSYLVDKEDVEILKIKTESDVLLVDMNDDNGEKNGWFLL